MKPKRRTEGAAGRQVDWLVVGADGCCGRCGGAVVVAVMEEETGARERVLMCQSCGRMAISLEWQCLRCVSPAMKNRVQCERHHAQHGPLTRTLKYQLRGAKGLCPMCGARRSGEHKLCAVCLPKRWRLGQARRRLAVQLRFCLGCSRRINDTEAQTKFGRQRKQPYCRGCQDKMSVYTAAARARVIAAGICTACHRRPVARKAGGGRSQMCLECGIRTSKILKARKLKKGVEGQGGSDVMCDDGLREAI